MTARGSVSAWCIDRPVATLLLTFALVLLGLIAFPQIAYRPTAGSRIPDDPGHRAVTRRQP